MGSVRAISVTILIAVTILLNAVGQAGASTVLYSTFGPGDSYNPFAGVSVGGYLGEDQNFSVARPFSFAGTESYLLDSITLAAGLNSSGANLLNVAITTDAGGVPGTVLESFSFTDQMWSFGFPDAPLLVGTSITQPLLTPGTTYWITASAPDGTRAAWNETWPPVQGPLAFSLNGGPWIPTYDEFSSINVFRINGAGVATVVPAPGALLLGLVGLACLRRVRRRRLP